MLRLELSSVEKRQNSLLLVHKNDKNITKFRSKMAKERQQVNCIIVFLGILFEPLKNFLLTCDSHHD